MSKKHGAKRKRRKAGSRRRVLCASCREPAGGPAVLEGIAAAFSAAADAGVKVKLVHVGGLPGIVMTSQGYVLPMPDGKHWCARTQVYTEFSAAGLAEEMED